ncbi:MAG: MinD/ParA family protein [Gammaproteobacteria bacterium]
MRAQIKPSVRPLNQPIRVIAVTSGKGGVGKTSVSVNLAAALVACGQRVILLDADLGLANVDVMLGLQSTYNLSHVLQGECTLEDVILSGPGGLQIVPAASGLQHMTELTIAEHAGLVHAFSELSHHLDVLVVDTAAGITDSVVTFCCASQEVIVVVCDEPASITDAYGLIKLLNRDHDLQRFRILSNMVNSTQEGLELFQKICRVTDRYLNVSLDYIGSVPSDEYVRKAVKKQRAVFDAFPRSRSALAFKTLAKVINNWPKPSGAAGHLEFFVEQLVHAGGDKLMVIQ